MKKIGILLFALLGYFMNAQTTCETAAPFCASGVSGVTFPATENSGSAQAGPYYGCLGTVPNPSWYYLQVSTSGNLKILIQGQIVSPPGPGQDVDFICWGPFSSLAGICNSLTINNVVDCSYSNSFTETLTIPSGVSGQYYLVLITNFANAHQDIIFQQYAGTGTTNCGLVTKNSVICAGQTGTIVASNTGSLVAASYSLNPGNLTNSTGTFVLTPSVTTTYSLYVTGTTTLNVLTTQTAVATITVNPQPASAVTLTNTTCTSTLNAFNLGLTFFPPTPVPNYTINWSPIPNGLPGPTSTTLSGAIPPGQYNATITAAGGCSTTTNFVLNPIPDPAVISLSPLGLTQTVTCFQPTVTMTSLIATNNYTWSNGIIAPITGTLAALTSTAIGNWTIFAVNPLSNCVASKTFTVALNVTTPTGAITPTFQTINCSIGSITTITTTANPTINITQQILSPQGGTFSAQSQVVNYQPGGVGIYTHCIVNNVNGCSSCNNFTVTSNMGFPTYTVVSSQNFTLGCNSTSIAGVNIIGGNTTPPGGSVSYTLIGPPTSSNTLSGPLSGASTYTVNVPGTWTVITRDNLSFCETRTPISILSNTFAPDISAIVPRQILDCNVPRVTLQAQSLTGNVDYLWSFPVNPGNIGNLQGDTISVSTLTASTSNSLIANYTLTITDKNSTCSSFSVIPMNQNLYPPKAVISGGNSSLTCLTSTIVLTNQSSTGIPTTPGGYPNGLSVVGYLWDGPSPQQQGQLESTYIAATVGIYTLTAKDLNNGCMAKTTASIIENRVYPILNRPKEPDPFILDCGSTSVKIYPFVSNLSSGFTYTWTTNGVITNDVNSLTLTTTQPGIYKMITTNTINGCSSSAQVSVINGTLSAAFETQTLKGFAPLNVTFYNNSVSSNGAANITAYWNFGNGTSSVTTASNLSPNTVYTQPGTYTVTMYANKGTCIDTLSKRIEVEIPSLVEVPNVFTPNGDDVNDFFFLKASNLEKISMLIYDRWGHIVFNLESDKGNISWDGKNQYGKEAAEGTYFYMIKATGKDGVVFDKKGTVSLYR